MRGERELGQPQIGCDALRGQLSDGMWGDASGAVDSTADVRVGRVSAAVDSSIGRGWGVGAD